MFPGILKIGLCFLLCGAAFADDGVEHISALTTKHSGMPVRLRGDDAAVTADAFKPPVDITIIAKTDSTNLRMSYAADQVIFNWEGDVNQLRIDGGPAGGMHQAGRGRIPTNKYVTIRWLVTPTGQEIYVDGKLRFAHQGDYSKIDSPISVFPKWGSVVTVKSIKTSVPK